MCLCGYVLAVGNDPYQTLLTSIFPPPSHSLFLRMRLRRECEEAMHSIAMITVRLQSCLNVEHRTHTL